MREMRWSWTELEATPPYVRHICWDFIMRSRRAGNERARRAQEQAGTDPGTVRIRR